MKKLFITTIICLIILPVVASAYQLLQPLPGIEGGDNPTLSNYLTWLFRFALAAAAFLAVLKIVIGGLHIIIGGASETAQTKGREMIYMALWGLLLAISSVLILTTINPNLVSTGFTIPPIEIKSSGGSGNGGGAPVDSCTGTCRVECLVNIEDRIDGTCSIEGQICCGEGLSGGN